MQFPCNPRSNPITPAVALPPPPSDRPLTSPHQAGAEVAWTVSVNAKAFHVHLHLHSHNSHSDSANVRDYGNYEAGYELVAVAYEAEFDPVERIGAYLPY